MRLLIILQVLILVVAVYSSYPHSDYSACIGHSIPKTYNQIADT